MELYGDKIYIQTTEDGGNGSVVISSTGQAYENVFVGESDADIHYEYKIDNCGVWLWGYRLLYNRASAPYRSPT